MEFLYHHSQAQLLIMTATVQKHYQLNLLQAQRDYFGAHTYQRVDKEGVFHTNWME